MANHMTDEIRDSSSAEGLVSNDGAYMICREGGSLTEPPEAMYIHQ